MSEVSISEAARLAGISRSYLYRKYITPGAISTNKDSAGNPVIDTSEIMRVFGSLQGDSEQAVNSRQADTPENNSKTVALQTEVQLLREQLTAAADREKWMQGKIDQLADQLASTTRLLEHKEAATSEKEADIKQQDQLNVYRKKTIWSRLFRLER